MNAPTSTTTRSDRRRRPGAPAPRRATLRAQVYRFLALAFAEPVPGAAAALACQWPVAAAALAGLGLGAAAAAADAAVPVDDAARARAHLEAFGHAISKECPPYGAEYGQAHIFEKSQTLADVAGFYRAFGLELAAGVRDRPDHVAFELEFMEFLCLKEDLALLREEEAGRLAIIRDAERAFLASHLGLWAFAFARRLQRRAVTGPFAASARLLEAFMAAELAAMAIARRPDPFVNDGTADRPDDCACGACPVAAGGLAAATEV